MFIDEILILLVVLLIPLLFSIIIFGIGFLVRKLIKREAKSNKKVFLLTTIFSYLLFGLFIYFYSFRPHVPTTRAQVTEAMWLTSSAKTALTEFYEDNGKWPNNFNEISDATSGKYVDSIIISQGAGASGDIIIMATFKETGAHKDIQGKTFSISSDDGGKTWQCGLNAISGTNLESKNLPGACKQIK